jgi:DNA polymerase-3 subunit gamma/tau
MEHFVVSARKYRPQNFSTVVGQSHITTTLKNAILQNQLAHAFLFCGPRGVGKTTCARILAKTINCENRQPDGEACNACQSCISFNKGSSFNIHELDAASNNSVEDIRTLTEQVRFAPQAGKYKVYIIDEVHALGQVAFNAFLKTLEEPPPYAIFILATTEKHKILPTILSRCQIFDFKRIKDKDTVEHLEEIAAKENIKAEKAALQVIAQKSEGCMRDALSILDKIVSFTGGEITYANTLEHLNILDEEYFFRFLDFMEQQDMAGAMLLYDEIDLMGFDGEMLLDGLAGFFRNLMVSKDERTHGLLEVVESFRDKYAKAAKKTSLAWLIGAINILNEAEIGYRQARNKKLHVELTLIRMAYLQQALEWTDDESGSSKKKRIDNLKPIGYRKIPMMELKVKNTGKTEEALPVGVTEGPSPEARLWEEKKQEKQNPVVSAISAGATTTKPSDPVRPDPPQDLQRPGMGALHRIRQQMQNRSQLTEQASVLTEESLEEAWTLYIRKLTEEKNHTTAANLKSARKRITGEHSFEIITDTIIQQRFIEQERGPLIEHLHQFFRNRLIIYQVLLDSTAEETLPVERPLNKREQYLQMTEEFPLVKALKDRLGLDLE